MSMISIVITDAQVSCIRNL